MKICSKFTEEDPCQSMISIKLQSKATLFKSHFGIGVLLKICCIFSEQLFLRTPLDGCFCHKYVSRILVKILHPAANCLVNSNNEIIQTDQINVMVVFKVKDKNIRETSIGSLDTGQRLNVLRRSKDVLCVFSTFHVRSIYVLCPGGGCLYCNQLPTAHPIN